MPKYIIKFKKVGLIKYTSHLDMLRLFKRAIKAADIPLEYSQGYNPHPKIGFAQPLSLGHTSLCEYLEFISKEALRESIILPKLKDEMPIGIELISMEKSDEPKPLASLVISATYRAILPISFRARGKEIEELLSNYLKQDEILAIKREKKTKKYVEKNIKQQIRDITVEDCSGKIALLMDVDCGSQSNLNPELILQSFAKYSEITIEKGDYSIERIDMKFNQ